MRNDGRSDKTVEVVRKEERCGGWRPWPGYDRLCPPEPGGVRMSAYSQPAGPISSGGAAHARALDRRLSFFLFIRYSDKPRL